MSTEKTKKNDKKYVCINCQYYSSKKTDYQRHLLTIKHKTSFLSTNKNDNREKNEPKYGCDNCTRLFTDRSGLWRHTKSCNKSVRDTQKMEVEDKSLIVMLVKQNAELLEVIKNGTNNTNNTNCNNKTFNLNFFLNETCKNAMNIMDFVNSIKLQLNDLENVGKLGYVDGISNIIVKNLKELDFTQRPVHCTDKKRETLYIKDDDKWEKDDDEKHKLRKAIKTVVSKNHQMLPKFKAQYPDCVKYASPFSDQYNKIIIEALGGDGENELEKEDKIIKRITNTITIDK